MTDTNDRNPHGSKWWNDALYGINKTIYPEEDHQVAAVPKRTLLKELERRWFAYADPVTWQGKTIDFSAVSNKQLLHHIGVYLERSP